MRAAAGDVWPLLDQGIAVLVLGKPTAISSFTAVELSTRRIVDITASSTFARPYLEARPPSRLWGVTDGTKLTYVNLVARKAGTTFAPSFVWLDQEITSIQALDPPLDANPTNPQKPRYLVVGHNDPDGIGNLTFLDADTPDRSTARTAYGFLFSNYLERGQP